MSIATLTAALAAKDEALAAEKERARLLEVELSAIGEAFGAQENDPLTLPELAQEVVALSQIREAARVKAEGALQRVRKVRNGYESQAKFADVDPGCYFREFVRRIDAALNAPGEPT